MRVYNTAPDLLERAIESALYQTLNEEEYELLIIDDASKKEETIAVLRKYEPRARIIRHKQNAGNHLKNLTEGIREARGKYFTICDDDDMLPPNALSDLLSALENHPEAGFSYADYFEHSVSGGMRRVSVQDNIFHTIAGGILWNTGVLRKLGGYDEGMFLPEYDLLIRAMNVGFHGLYVPEVTVYEYWRRSESLTGKSEDIQRAMTQYREKYGKTHPGVLDLIRKY